MSKIDRRHRRSVSIRREIARRDRQRLCVHRTPRHIYAQIISADGSQVLASASTVEAEIRKQVSNGGNVTAAQAIGKRIAEKAKAAGVTKVAFDRSGFRYHGRIKALADAAREGGLEF
ncbi:MAG: 50S ribosomal protein L18 [Gammaproteobacteria bacterium]|nr:50S ribosomal protein L18 [Gammaproteobacteria bacterium]